MSSLVFKVRKKKGVDEEVIVRKTKRRTMPAPKRKERIEEFLGFGNSKDKRKKENSCLSSGSEVEEKNESVEDPVACGRLWSRVVACCGFWWGGVA